MRSIALCIVTIPGPRRCFLAQLYFGVSIFGQVKTSEVVAFFGGSSHDKSDNTRAHVQKVCVCARQHVCSLLHWECHVFILKSHSLFSFSRSLSPRFTEKRPTKLRLEIEIQWHAECNRLYEGMARVWKCAVEYNRALSTLRRAL